MVPRKMQAQEPRKSEATSGQTENFTERERWRFIGGMREHREEGTVNIPRPFVKG